MAVHTASQTDSDLAGGIFMSQVDTLQENLDQAPVIHHEQIIKITNGFTTLTGDGISGRYHDKAVLQEVVNHKAYLLGETVVRTIEQPINWLSVELEIVAARILEKYLPDQMETLKYLEQFTREVLAPLKGIKDWGITSTFIENRLQEIIHKAGPSGLDNFKPTFGRDVPITWILQPDETRKIDHESEFDQNGFCGMVWKDQVTISYRNGPHNVRGLECRTDLIWQEPAMLDWRKNSPTKHQVALAILTQLYDVPFALRVHLEFSRRVLDRLPQVFWTLSETSINTFVDDILQNPPQRKREVMEGQK
jgi:hypothetical protein